MVVELHAAAASEAISRSYVRRAPEHGVLHRAPVRQWVLSLPFELRYRLAWDHQLCRAVFAVYTRALLGFYRKRAKASGHQDGRTGTVTVIQRFGGALNLNVHFDTLAVDGVFVREPDGSIGFVAAKAPTDEEVEALLGVIRKQVLRLLMRPAVQWRGRLRRIRCYVAWGANLKGRL